MTASVGERLPVAVLGATGLVGQHLLRLLDRHPWLCAAEVVASPARAGRAYREVVRWALDGDVPDRVAGMVLRSPTDPVESPVVLSALPAAAARGVERRLAAEGRLVCTNASAHRMDADVPLVVPEVNASTVTVGPGERSGRLVANPNCVVAGVALALAPIHERWGIEEGTLVTLQALSGAGLDGPSALGLVGNVVPWIDGEEEKIPGELRKVLGVDADFAVAVNRVPVVDGHTAHVFLRLGRSARVDEVFGALSDFRGSASARALPTLPERPLVVRAEPDRPQPRRDAAAGGGMSVTVGRVRTAPPHDLALTVVVHNALRGAAGACLANAELCLRVGWRAPVEPPAIAGSGRGGS